MSNTNDGAEPVRPADGKQPAGGASVLGRHNLPREAQNPDIVLPPATDKGTIPNLRWSFADSHIQLYPGGWTRQTTVRELPVSTEVAGVNMRLGAGAVREMHWHKAAEWGYVLAGTARVTSVDQEGRTFQDDTSPGQLWFFPGGTPHSIQGLGPDGVEFLLIFDDGNFSEDNTFLLTDMTSRLPPEVIAKNFGWTMEQVGQLPKTFKYIFQSEVPGPLETDKIEGAGPVPKWFKHDFGGQEPKVFDGGTVRIADSTNFPASDKIAAALVELEPGALREIHWHNNVDEWQYYLSGRGRMTVFASSSISRTFDFQAGDVGAVPYAMGHYIENTGTEPLRFLEVFASDRFEDVSLKQWLALTPHELVAAHLEVPRAWIDALPSEKQAVVPGKET